MSASAREAGSPRSVSHEPLDHEPLDSKPFDEELDGNPNEYAPLEDAASTEGPLDSVSAPPGIRTEAPEASQPPWKQKRPRQAFAGDVAIAKSRTDLVKVPGPMSEPPGQAPQAPIARIFSAIIVASVAVIGTVSYLSSPAPGPNVPDRIDIASAGGELPASLQRLPAKRVVPAPAAQPALAPVSALRSFFSQSEEASSRERARQLTIKAARLWRVDAPARLIASPVDNSWDVDAVISGLASGSAVSIGTPAGPNGWRLPVRDLNQAAITPPRGFVGTMDLVIELRLANDAVIDRKDVLLEWSHNSTVAIAPFPPPLLEAPEIKLMVKSGLKYMANGQIGAARLMFQSAAEAGEAAAAFALAETYDPIVLEKLGVKGGITPDVALARRWYEKAKELGSSAAPERIARPPRRSE